MKPGEVVGAFTLEARIGRGGGGEVWRASDAAMGRKVALKFPAGEGEELARFRREAQIAAGLEHPNIAAVYGVGEHEGRPYLAMQLVDGTTLEALRGAEPRRAAAAVRDAARAVQFAHERGIIHRDLKPGNVMLASDGRVFVMDFGLARAVASGSTMTASGMLVGTPAYMGPEQARGEPVDPRSDVYGLGATLYDLIAGRPPFDGADLASLLIRVIDEEPPRLRADGALEAIVLKCLEKDPARRYGTAGAFADDLDRWLAGEGVTARRSFRLSRGARRLLWAAAAILLFAGGTMSIVAWRVKRAARSAQEAERDLVERMRRTSDACLQAALDLRRSGDLPAMRKQAREVELACQEVIRRMPRLAEPHHRLGRIYRALMRDDDALREQETALTKEPGLIAAVQERIYLLSGRLRVQLNRSQSLALAEAGARLAREGVRQVPQDLDFEDEVARRLRDRLVADATTLEAAGSQVGPGELAMARALVAFFSGRRSQAMELLAVAERHSPDLEQVYAMAASLETANRRPEHAEAWYTKGLARDGGYVPFWVNRGLSRMNLALRGRKELAGPALADLDTAVRLDPELAESWFQRGHARMNRLTMEWDDALFEAAVADVAEAARLEPDWAEPWSTRAMMHTNLSIEREQRGEGTAPALEAALEAAEQAIRREPSGSRPFWARGRALALRASAIHRRGEDAAAAYRSAAEDFDRAIASNPVFAENWSARGLALYGWAQADYRFGRPVAERFQRAIADFDQALALDRTDARTLWRRADALAALARVRVEAGEDPRTAFDEALRDAARSAQLDDADPNAIESSATTRLMWADALIARGGDAVPLLRGAVAELERAAGMAGATRETRTRLARARLQLGIIGGGGGDLERAVLESDALVKERPLLEEGRLIRANAKLALSRMAGSDAELLLREAEADIREARRLNPRRDEGRVLEAGVRTTRGLRARDRGADAVEEFSAAAALLEDAVKHAPRDGRLRGQLAGLLVDLGAELQKRGRDPVESYRRCVEIAEETLRHEPWRTTMQVDLGHARRNWAQFVADGGGDAEPLFRGAVAAFEKGAAAGNHDATRSLATALLNWGSFVEDRQGDPLELYRRAVEAGGRAAEADPKDAAAWRVRGHAAFNRSRLLFAAGKPMQEELRIAIEAYTKSIEADPTQEAKLRPLIEACRRRLE